MRKDIALAGEIDAKHCSRQNLRHGAFGNDLLFLRHARRIYQPVQVAQGYVCVTQALLPAGSMHTRSSASRFNGTVLMKVLAGIREAPHVSTTRPCGEAHPAL